MNISGQPVFTHLLNSQTCTNMTINVAYTIDLIIDVSDMMWHMIDVGYLQKYL